MRHRPSRRRLADVTIDERLLAQPDDFAFTREHRKRIPGCSFNDDEFD